MVTISQDGGELVPTIDINLKIKGDLLLDKNTGQEILESLHHVLEESGDYNISGEITWNADKGTKTTSEEE